ncbi:dihydrolipoamide acetyltransferase component [Ameyamaea chiangmaiensis NBRC 103196]|uniref:Acetyltransferase component of pyruvate dehydrogenase complex n=1 Tax=Ameyamaea chiangmaiensis TaxID=442969 RepID=A0A850P795_9PROT|nr:pyruvate dehydrogenase complex dihydrolipoamide acetyltransferase [Ameyamaea chiangmaiensis]MBS4073700.1 pyruvate dehydrogenase complex dihydrolipoamide acetyltransferase [Ameyamaea chiangmaiensis]NVN39808.1 pyruvate dehydrogenase complex dihydrolipoamide acetyltransferase [Ameyamaea chiangmaiensis]GBQ68765.1 dihydrolipoamide acetyltransferase component [Ameyamaea chiangmaiensis NBRC 103196]
MAVDILMPALSPTMTEGKLARWLKKEGDTVASGDVIAEIETDKATMEVEAVEEGILGRILVAEGSEGVKVNAPIAILVEDGESVPEGPSAPTPKNTTKAEVAKTIDAPTVAAPATAASKPADKPANRIVASPLARRLAREAGLDLATITGSGPYGRIVRRDVEGHTPAPKAAPKSVAATPAGGGSRAVPNSSMRKVIARRLTESKSTVPHFYVSIDVELDALLALRSQLNAVSPSEGPEAFKLSVNDLLIKAAAVTLKRVPGVNVSYTDEATIFYDDADISVAVSIPDGLITPIVRAADRKSVRTISTEAKGLIAKARAGKLKPEEFQGGTFSISNMGMFGVKDFAAIINPPQAAILAVAAGEKRAVVKGDDIRIATVMTVTLSVDHRAVDGALAAEFVSVFKSVVESPMALVV